MPLTRRVPGQVHRSDFRYTYFAPSNPLTLVLAENEKEVDRTEKARGRLPSFSSDGSARRIVVAMR